jgi:hypothetical protein
MWFNILNGNPTAPLPVTTASAPASTPASLLFNALNTDPLVRAQVNLYVQANIVRDFTLSFNPAYPTLMNQNFPARANRTDGFCPPNAWYDPSEVSINFCQAGASNPNTAFSSVIHHEYGHHLVAAGGSGQGAYGEGMGDVMSLLLADDPRLGIGFSNNCSSGIRNANNTCQYQTTGCSSCGSEAHACGQLISGCVWSTRDELIITDPVNYLDILSNLAINSILMHNGSTINPTITVDYLTLDDNDADIFNGTPHYAQIAAGFGEHNMDAPELSLVTFAFPGGQPYSIAPNGGTTMRVVVTNVAGTALPGTGMLHVNTGSGFVASSMTVVSATEYDAVFPASTCGTEVPYYVSVQTSGGPATFPAGAPTTTLLTLSAYSVLVVGDFDFETSGGFTVSNGAGLVDGAWDRGIPVDCQRGDPPADADGSGQCWLTDNSSANACNSDVDDGSTSLLSPVLDATAGNLTLSYYRWYSNNFGALPGADTFVVEFSLNGGGTWTNLETVGPTGSGTTGGWFLREYELDSVPGFTPTSQFRLRFTATDLPGQGSVIEAAVDGVSLYSINCTSVPGDVNGDGVVDVNDLLELLAAWGPCPPGPSCPADFDDNGEVDITDLLFLLANWT